MESSGSKEFERVRSSSDQEHTSSSQEERTSVSRMAVIGNFSLYKQMASLTEDGEHVAATTDMETVSETKLVFMIGRMNPPTPGHMAAIETVLRLANEEDGIPRIYVSPKVNEKVPPYDFLTADPEDKPKIPRGAKAQAAVDSAAAIPMYVKDPRGENPLHADVKKRVIIDMVMNRQNDASWTAGEWTRPQLEEIVVISDDCKGMYKAFACAQRTQQGASEEPDPARITYVMGKEIDPQEAAVRDANCIEDGDEAAFARYKCVQLTRTKGTGGPESYSGSQIRLLAGCISPDEAEFVNAYEGYLTREQALTLFGELRSGLCMRERKRRAPIDEEDEGEDDEVRQPQSKRRRRPTSRAGRRTRKGTRRHKKRGRRAPTRKRRHISRRRHARKTKKN